MTPLDVRVVDADEATHAAKTILICFDVILAAYVGYLLFVPAEKKIELTAKVKSFRSKMKASKEARRAHSEASFELALIVDWIENGHVNWIS